ncbi:MAG: LAGLIDADG family homing endonuclease [Candidatus Aenigmatarchaeota archaeon]
MNRFLLLGLLYSSGTLKWGNGYKIEFQTERPELAAVLRRLLPEIGKSVSRQSQKSAVSVTGRDEIKNFLLGFGLTPPLEKEKIPLSLLDTGEKRAAFLRGFFEGKSSVYPEKGLIRVSGKKGQLGAIKSLLETEGVQSRIYQMGKYYALYIEGKSRCEAFKKIGFLTREKNEKLNRIALFEKAIPKLTYKNHPF